MNCSSPGCSTAGWRLVPALLGWALLAPGPVGAQLPPPAPADTTARPVVDTSDVTGMLLRAEEDTRARVPAAPRIGTANLLPAGSRIILTRDSIEFMNAETIGDAISEVPGVFLWRGGWLGRAELPNYLGRGATSVEWVIDGVPLTQLGFDSLTVDPSLLPIGWVERIEIEQLPGLLRVHLMFREQEVLAPWTRLSVARGTYEQARYEGILQKRAAGGLGYTVGVSYNLSNGFNSDVGDFQAAHAWLEASYVPSDRFGARVRYRLSTPDRDPSLAEGTPPRDTLARPLRRDRGDLEARVFLAQRSDGLGRQIDFLVTRSSWSYDTLRTPYLEPGFSQDLIRAGVVMTHRWARRSVGGQLFYGSKWTRVDARLNAGWALTDRLTTALEGAYQVHQDSRASYWGMARAGISLPLGASLSGAWRVGQVVAMPSVPADQAQSLSDREFTASLEQPGIGARVSYTRTAGFSPVPYYQFPQVDTIGPHGPTEWVTGHLRLAPRQWLVFQGWYSTALGTQPEGTPPDHSIITGAIRSKFLRTFPSGIFDLKLELAAENWGSGVLGRDRQGTPVPIRGATFLRGLIQLKLGSFTLYYDRYNLANTRLTYHPGLRQPAQAYTFGIRWSFLN